MLQARFAEELEAARAADAADPLAGWRAEFRLPEGLIHLNGNSLGPLPERALARLKQVAEEEWGRGLIRSWNEAGWWARPVTLGDRLGQLLGAAPGQVLVCDSTSANLFKLLVAAMRLRPGRRVLVSAAENFPSDLYIAQGVRDLLPGMEIRLWDGVAPLASLLDADVAAVMLTHVDYRTAEMLPAREITALAQGAGALMIWDLAHSAGAVPVDLDGWGADFAVGCSYKYLNAGPGGPALLYVAARHIEAASQPLTGWTGHATPFDFDGDYVPDAGIRRFLCGTPPLLAFAPLEASLELWEAADREACFAKMRALSERFIRLSAAWCPALALASPADAARRGAHVALRFAEGYRLMKALIARGVLGDFRAPELMRFGFSPFHNSHADVVRAVAVMAELLESGAWREEAAARATVT